MAGQRRCRILGVGETHKRRYGPHRGYAISFRLLLASEKRWRRVNAPHLVALAEAGVEFPNGRAEMLGREPAPSGLSTPIPWMIAAEEPIYKIRQYLIFICVPLSVR